MRAEKGRASETTHPNAPEFSVSSSTSHRASPPSAFPLQSLSPIVFVQCSVKKDVCVGATKNRRSEKCGFRRHFKKLGLGGLGPSIARLIHQKRRGTYVKAHDTTDTKLRRKQDSRMSTMTALLRSSTSRPLRCVAIPRGQRPIDSLVADDGRGMRRCPSHRRGEGVFQRRATAAAAVTVAPAASSIPAEPDDRPHGRRRSLSLLSSLPPHPPPPSSSIPAENDRPRGRRRSLSSSSSSPPHPPPPSLARPRRAAMGCPRECGLSGGTPDQFRRRKFHRGEGESGEDDDARDREAIYREMR